MTTIKEAVNKLVKTADNSGIICKVTAYDSRKFTCTCEPLNGLAKFFKVRLNTNNTDNYIKIPKLGSNVIISLLDKNNAYISMFSELEKVILKIENTEIEINQDNVLFNGGNNGGLILIEKLVEKINNLENNFLAHLHTNGAGPTGTPQDATLAPIIFVPTLQSELENIKIKH